MKYWVDTDKTAHKIRGTFSVSFDRGGVGWVGGPNSSANKIY